MKKGVFVAGVFAFIFAFSNVSHAIDGGYVSIGGGAGGQANGANLTTDIGFLFTSGVKNWHMAGFSVATIFNSDPLPANAVSGYVPHTNYTVLDVVQDGHELFMVFRYGFMFLRERGIYFSVLLGASNSFSTQVVQSTATLDEGWIYLQPYRTSYYFVAGGGVHWFLPDRRVFFLADLDNRRGATLSVGLYIKQH